MDARMALVKNATPPAWTKGYPENFGETHNDHLQTAAETRAARISPLPGRGGSRRRIFEGLRVPATGRAVENRVAPRIGRFRWQRRFFVLCLAQFPLQIAAPRLMFITLAALTLGWDGHRA